MTGYKTRKPAQIEYYSKNTAHIQQLRDKLLKEDQNTRMFYEYKELIKVVKEMSFFKKTRIGLQFGDDEAMEIVKHIKIKYFPPNKEIYMPGEWSNAYYFILRGKVIMGVNSETKRHGELLNM